MWPCPSSKASLRKSPKNAPSVAEVLKSVTPGQQVVKIVNDALVDMLGAEEPVGLNMLGEPPVAIMMVGLQGSGKTTSTAKIAKAPDRERHARRS